MSPTIGLHRHVSTFFLFLTSPPPACLPLFCFLSPACEDKIVDYSVPLPILRVSSDATLPATPPYFTHYATLDYTNFRFPPSLFVSLFTFYLAPLLSLCLIFGLPFIRLSSCALVCILVPYDIVCLPHLHCQMRDRAPTSILHARVYVEYYARSDSLTQQRRTSVPLCSPSVNHLIRSVH